jgi:M6 family metalloprotease-like protein
MVEGTVHVDESAAVPKVDIAIINDNSVAVSIFRLDPKTFEEESVAELSSGEEKSVPMWVTDCLVAKIDGKVVAEFGCSEELREWRLPSGDSEHGHHCRFVVENHRSESVTLFRTAGENGKTLQSQVLDPGAQTVVDSFSGEYWEAIIGDQVVSAHQPSARLPMWAVNDVDCDFVPPLPTIDYTNLNETSEPRPKDQPAVGEVKAVMVFVDFPDVPGKGSLDEIKKAIVGDAKDIVGDAEDWFWQESYGRLNFSVETPVLQWRRMPEPATAYADIKKSADSHQSYIITALKLFSREEIDFNAYQIAYVVAAEIPDPANDTRYEGVLDNSPTLSAGIEVVTNNGKVNHVVTFGRDSYHRGFRVLVHETGHLFGLPDLYLFHPTAERKLLIPAGAWDIMCDLYTAWHFLGWHKYKLGWLDESQLIYFESGEVSMILKSLETAHGIKMIVMPGEHLSQLYVVEVAQSLGEGEQFRDYGLLVYTVDASVATGHEPVSVMNCGTTKDEAAVTKNKDAVGALPSAYLAEGQRYVVTLAHGNVVEIVNQKQIGADFEVTVKSTGAGQRNVRKPVPCRICDPRGDRKVWLRAKIE